MGKLDRNGNAEVVKPGPDAGQGPENNRTLAEVEAAAALSEKIALERIAALEQKIAELTTEPVYPGPKGNPFNAVFGDITFQHVKNGAGTFDTGKKKTRKLADVSVALRNGPGVIPGSVQLKSLNGGEPFIEFNFFSSMFGTAVAAVDGASETALTEYRAYVVEEGEKWLEKNPPQTKTTAGISAKRLGLTL